VIEALALLLGCQLAGEVLVRMLALPLPGPVVGLVLLLAGLMLRRRVPAELDRTATTLLQNLSLLFVPAGVGIMQHVGRLQAEWPALLAALLVSTAATVVVTAVVFRLAARLMARFGAADDEAGHD
jgi:putative effector of murein hydrolase LrgA (UPF0299 family)